MRVAVIVAAALVWAQQANAEPVDRRAAANPRGEIDISNVAGSVNVVGWNRSEVHVQGDLGSDVERLEFDADGRRTRIRVVLPQESSRGGSADLTIHVPRDSSVKATTVSADQKISEVRGAQRLKAVSGDIETDAWDEDFEIETISGEITVRGHGGKGAARVTTVSGDVRLEDIGRQLDIENVSGDIEVRAKELERARIETTNGELRLRAALARDARIEAEAINGDLVFQLLGTIDAEFEIETFNGDIENCFGPKPRKIRQYAPGKELRFTEGKGSARVRIKTLNGGVELCNK
ncbi:MAG: DUF4097 family beta strand repeat-containing protein [Steroidobacteraceae bacterium]